MSETPEPKPMSRWAMLAPWQQVVVTAVISAVLLVIAAGIMNLLGTGTVGGPDERGARDVCEQFVEKRLKAPSTAEFGDVTTSQDGEEWTVRGAVDAENSFGAPIRNDYACTVTPNNAEGTDWTLVDMQLGE